ncbi:MAG: GNAT family N-acetyltransferase [Aestuariivirga sp.]
MELREITFETVRSIIKLEVSANQKAYVASNAVSIAEAHFNPGAWFRGIYAEDAPVGFVMLLDPTIPGAMSRGPIAKDEVYLWRLMIDLRHRRKGYGKKALDLVCEKTRLAGKARSIISSYVEGPDGPESFYLSYGFHKTGRFRNKGQEIEIVLPLKTSY